MSYYVIFFLLTVVFCGFTQIKHLLITFTIYFFGLRSKHAFFMVFNRSDFVINNIIGRKCRFLLSANWYFVWIDKQIYSEKHIEKLWKFKVTILQRINYEENGFDISKMLLRSFQTAEKMSWQRIRGIIRWRSVSKNGGAYRYSGSDPTTSIQQTLKDYFREAW